MLARRILAGVFHGSPRNLSQNPSMLARRTCVFHGSPRNVSQIPSMLASSLAGVFHGSPSILIVQALVKLVSEATLRESSPTVFSQSFNRRISSQSDSFNANVRSLISENQSKSMVDSTPYVDIPKPLPKRKRKPLVTPIKDLIGRARKVREMNQDVTERVLQRPENGLLVRRLVPVAHEVYQARNALYEGVDKLVDAIPVQACRNCLRSAHWLSGASTEDM